MKDFTMTRSKFWFNSISFTHRKISAPKNIRNPIHTNLEELNRDCEYETEKNRVKNQRVASYLGSEKVKQSFNKESENHFMTSNVFSNTSFNQINSYRKTNKPILTMSEPKKARYIYGSNNSVIYS